MWKSAGLVGILVCAAVLVGCAAGEKEKSIGARAPAEQPARERAVPEQKAPAAQTDAVAAGRAIYDGNCSSCHRAGSYDKQGKGDLARRVDEISHDFLAKHHGGTLSNDDTANLKAFLRSINVDQ